MALVHVEDGGLDAAGGERLDAADAEQDLLAQAVLAVAAVEAVGDRALGRARCPARRSRAAAAGRGRRRRARAAACSARARQSARRSSTGAPSAASTGVSGSSAGSSSTNSSCCAPLARQQLAEVAVAVEEADADDRHAEVAGRLEVVAGEDAEPARVLRQRLAEAELGREVGDRARAHRAASRTSRAPPGARPAGPRPTSGARGSRRRRASSREPRGRGAGEHRDRVARGAARPPGSTSASTPRSRHPTSRRGCARAGRAARGPRAAARSWTGRVAGSWRVSPGWFSGRHGSGSARARRLARLASRSSPETELPGREGSVA